MPAPPQAGRHVIHRDDQRHIGRGGRRVGSEIHDSSEVVGQPGSALHDDAVGRAVDRDGALPSVKERREREMLDNIIIAGVGILHVSEGNRVRKNHDVTII